MTEQEKLLPVEVNNFLSAKAFEATQSGLRHPDADLTWKAKV